MCLARRSSTPTVTLQERCYWNVFSLGFVYLPLFLTSILELLEHFGVVRNVSIIVCIICDVAFGCCPARFGDEELIAFWRLIREDMFS